MILTENGEKNHSLDKVAQLVFRGEGVDDLVDDNHAVIHVQPRHGQAGVDSLDSKQFSLFVHNRNPLFGPKFSPMNYFRRLI